LLTTHPVEVVGVAGIHLFVALDNFVLIGAEFIANGLESGGYGGLLIDLEPNDLVELTAAVLGVQGVPNVRDQSGRGRLPELILLRK
jgi:hypothetical protein